MMYLIKLILPITLLIFSLHVKGQLPDLSSGIKVNVKGNILERIKSESALISITYNGWGLHQDRNPQEIPGRLSELGQIVQTNIENCGIKVAGTTIRTNLLNTNNNDLKSAYKNLAKSINADLYFDVTITPKFYSNLSTGYLIIVVGYPVSRFDNPLESQSEVIYMYSSSPIEAKDLYFNKLEKATKFNFTEVCQDLFQKFDEGLWKKEVKPAVSHNTFVASLVNCPEVKMVTNFNNSSSIQMVVLGNPKISQQTMDQVAMQNAKLAKRLEKANSKMSGSDPVEDAVKESKISNIKVIHSLDEVLPNPGNTKEFWYIEKIEVVTGAEHVQKMENKYGKWEATDVYYEKISSKYFLVKLSTNEYFIQEGETGSLKALLDNIK